MTTKFMTSPHEWAGGYGAIDGGTFDNTMVFLQSSFDLVVASQTTGDTFIVSGTQDTVSLQGGCSNAIVMDHGQGTAINILDMYEKSIAVYDFQRDLTGAVVFNRQGTAPTFAPDHHNGTLVTLFGGGTVDFVGAQLRPDQVTINGQHPATTV